jgi:hypothetical protein
MKNVQGELVRTGSVVQFDYTNWRGDDHTYRVVIESISYGLHGAKPGESVWQLHGYVTQRDGVSRLRQDANSRRSFELFGIRDMEVVQ